MTITSFIPHERVDIMAIIVFHAARKTGRTQFHAVKHEKLRFEHE